MEAKASSKGSATPKGEAAAKPKQLSHNDQTELAMDELKLLVPRDDGAHQVRKLTLEYH